MSRPKESPAALAGAREAGFHKTSGFHRTTASALRARLADHAHERRLKAALRAYLSVANDPAARAVAWSRYAVLHAQRSPGQVERMEAPRLQRARRAIKRGLMDGFVHGRIPKLVVSALFRAMRLQEV